MAESVEVIELVDMYRDYMCSICQETDHHGYCSLAKTIECMEAGGKYEPGDKDEKHY